uniref:Uncharacterized protein n=1 Tax=Catharus ustulatus TaxID=91951 RepID=A0A8C3UH82_CATUS
MTWSLPDGSRISGFHSEEQSSPGTHTALPGTWAASPGRWCCWPCTRTPSARRRARGCAPRCARPAAAPRGGTGPASLRAPRGDTSSDHRSTQGIPSLRALGSLPVTQGSCSGQGENRTRTKVSAATRLATESRFSHSGNCTDPALLKKFCQDAKGKKKGTSPTASSQN